MKEGESTQIVSKIRETEMRDPVDLVDSPGCSAQLFFPQLLAVRAMYFPSRRSLITFPPIYFLRLLSTGCVVVWDYFVGDFFLPLCLHRQSFCIQPAGISCTRQVVSTSCAWRVLVEQDMRILVCVLQMGGYLGGNLETAASTDKLCWTCCW